jgi:hypothetical protein
VCQPATLPSVDLESERAREKEVNTSSALGGTTTREIEDIKGDNGALNSKQLSARRRERRVLERVPVESGVDLSAHRNESSLRRALSF